MLISLLRPQMMISVKRPFSHLLFCISLCDFIGSIANIFGFPPSSSMLCPAQSFLFFFFFRLSWLFAVALMFQLRCAILFKKLWLKLSYIHMICCSLSILMNILPLSTNSYGIDDYPSGQYPCNFQGNTVDSFIWMAITFEVVGIVCIFLIVAWIIEIYWHHRRGRVSLGRDEWLLCRAMALYPVAMAVSWAPVFVDFICKLMNILEKKMPSRAVSISDHFFIILATQCGTFLGIIFFAQSHKAREICRTTVCGKLLSLCSKGSDRDSLFSAFAVGPGNSGEEFSDATTERDFDESQWTLGGSGTDDSHPNTEQRSVDGIALSFS